jgi:hypothetical protein
MPHRSGANPADSTDTRAGDVSLADASGQATRDKLEILRSPLLTRIDWLIHGFSTRKGGRSITCGQSSAGGELNLGFTNSDDPAAVVANREDFLESLAGDPCFPLVTLRQVHSSTVVRVEGPQAASNSGFAEGDGMMTDQPGILLAIQTADCIPVLVADRRHRAVAGFHAGWRGTVKQIVEEGVARMRSEFGSRPEDLVAAIGPGIGACCYEVGTEVEDEFVAQFTYAAELFLKVDSARTERSPGLGAGLHLDLVEANRHQLLGAGLAPDTIMVVQQCTSCNPDRFFSYRAERGTTGRMLSVIGIRPR